MGEKTVELTVDPVQKGSSVQFNMSLKNESDRDFEFTFNTSQNSSLVCMTKTGMNNTAIRKTVCSHRPSKLLC